MSVPSSVDGISSAAQKLAEKHTEGKSVVIEDVQDEDLPPKLDTKSHELFPELGQTKAKTSNVVPVWRAKNNANGKTNGSGSGGTSTPVSSTSEPSQKATPSMSIPGKNVESVVLDSSYIVPRTQLKRPIADIIKDINRKSRAVISMSPCAGGRLRFDATGPQEVAQQALKDLVQQIGTKVRKPAPALDERDTNYQ